jgi:hypothetical protein
VSGIEPCPNVSRGCLWFRFGIRFESKKPFGQQNLYC